MRKTWIATGALALAFAVSIAGAEAEAKGGGGHGGGFAAGGPPGFASPGHRAGWGAYASQPRGWSRGVKRGWGCTPGSIGCKPPGLRR